MPVALSSILDTLNPYGAKLIAVSKMHGPEAIAELYAQGQRDFGENWVQELTEKQAKLPSDIHWHFIGHLQTNKVKYIAPFVHLIHSVDSMKLLQEINKQAAKSNRVIPCLLEFKIAEEDSKHGLDLPAAITLLESLELKALSHIKIAGVMGMASFSDDEAQVRSEFGQLANIFKTLKARFFEHDPDFKEISMGMSGDYHLALEEGSTMVRIGTLLFGERDYA